MSVLPSTRPARSGSRAEATTMTAAQRVLAILEAFDQDHLLLTLSQISRRARLSLSTTHRLIAELKDWGALDRTADGRYAIGMRVLELGSLEPKGLRLREVALPLLGDLQVATSANVHLSVRDGHDVVYVESLRAARGAQVLSRLGGRWPMHATATGLVHLAFGDPAVAEEVLASPLQRFTPQTIVEPADLRRAIADVRTTGVAVMEASITPDAIAVAVPVRGTRDRLVASLGVTIKSYRTHPQTVIPALSATARAISRALGAPSAAQPPSRSGSDAHADG